MRSGSHGLTATLLMFVPLLAVPFLAAFGLPWFTGNPRQDPGEVVEFPSVPLGEVGVGQSRTAWSSAEDLFAPVVHHAPLDLRVAKGPGSALPAIQNPHLRNASLIVSHDKTWVDPFERMKASAPPPQPDPRGTSPSPPALGASSSPDALAGWTIKESFPAEPAPTQPAAEASAASASPEPPINPFEDFEAAARQPAADPETKVAVMDHAFDAPLPEARVNDDAAQFDGKRTLFTGNETPAPPTPSAPPDNHALPADNAAPAPSEFQQTPEVFTWETARQRLQELGIKRYYLEPDAEGRLFHFRCTYVPESTPRVYRHFESEAPEPLEAVRKVLAQVETFVERS